MASNDIEVLDPAATVEMLKETESGVALDRRHFLTALGVAGAAAGVIAGSGLLSSGPTAVAQQPKPSGYLQVDVMNFLMNIKFLKATLYAFLTTGADIPNYPTSVTFGSGQIYDQPAKITNFPTQQITDLFNEMYYDELNQLVDLRNLIGDATGNVQVQPRPTMDLLGLGNKVTVTTTITFQQAIGYARMLEDLSVQAFAGAAVYLTGANLAYVTQAMATNGFHAGALRLISIQNNIPYVGPDILLSTPSTNATIAPVNIYTGGTAVGVASIFLQTATNLPIIGNVIAGPGVPQGAVITGYTATANSTFTAIPNRNSATPAVLAGVSSVSGLAVGQPITGTNIPANTIITGFTSSAPLTVTMSNPASGITTVAPTGYITSGSSSITGVSSVSGVVVGQPIVGNGIPAGATVTAVSATNASPLTITMSASATATSTLSVFGILASGSPTINYASSYGNNNNVSNLSAINTGQPITGTGVPSGTTVSAVGTNTITISKNATATTAQPTAASFTGTATTGSTVITNVSSFTGLAIGQPILGPAAVIPPFAQYGGTTIAALNPTAGTLTLSQPVLGAALTPTGIVTPGSNVITGVSSTAGVTIGQPVNAPAATPGAGSAAVSIPAGTTVSAVTASTITMQPPPSTQGISGTVVVGNATVYSLPPSAFLFGSGAVATGLGVGQAIAGVNIVPGATITAVSASAGTVTMSSPALGAIVITGVVTGVSATLSSLSSTAGLVAGQAIVGDFIPAGTIITAVNAGAGTLTLSNQASGVGSATQTLTITPTVTTTGNVVAGLNTVSLLTVGGVSGTTGLAVGQTIAGNFILPGTTITAVNASAFTLTMSSAAIGSASGETLAIGVAPTSLTITAPGYDTYSGIVALGDNVVNSMSTVLAMVPGQTIVGNFIPAGTTITAVGTGAITMSNPATGSSFTAQPLVISTPASIALTLPVATAAVSLTATATGTFTIPTNTFPVITGPSSEALIIPTTVTVTVGRSVAAVSLPAIATAAGPFYTLTGDPMDVQPFDPGTAALAAAGPSAITLPPSTYSVTGPTNPVVYQGFFNTAGTGTASGSTPAGFAFARSFGQTLSVLLGTTQTNPVTYLGGFFPTGVAGAINANTDQ